METTNSEKDVTDTTSNPRGTCKSCTAFYINPNLPDHFFSGECRNRSITRYGWPIANKDGWCREYGSENRAQRELEFG